ncbi:MAG: hypothetical protein QF922_12045, partial [SAR324 cluster bacterium]|nr:hypothetical protein [SAR324 cluster bacterium]
MARLAVASEIGNASIKSARVVRPDQIDRLNINKVDSFNSIIMVIDYIEILRGSLTLDKMTDLKYSCNANFQEEAHGRIKGTAGNGRVDAGQ